MIEIPLAEWARQNNIHYNTAKRRFDKGLMPNAEYNQLGKIIVYLEYPKIDAKEEIENLGPKRLPSLADVSAYLRVRKYLDIRQILTK